MTLKHLVRNERRSSKIFLSIFSISSVSFWISFASADLVLCGVVEMIGRATAGAHSEYNVSARQHLTFISSRFELSLSKFIERAIACFGIVTGEQREN